MAARAGLPPSASALVTAERTRQLLLLLAPVALCLLISSPSAVGDCLGVNGCPMCDIAGEFIEGDYSSFLHVFGIEQCRGICILKKKMFFGYVTDGSHICVCFHGKSPCYTYDAPKFVTIGPTELLPKPPTFDDACDAAPGLFSRRPTNKKCPVPWSDWVNFRNCGGFLCSCPFHQYMWPIRATNGTLLACRAYHGNYPI